MEDKINGTKNTGIQDNEEMLYQEVEQQDKKIEAQESSDNSIIHNTKNL